MIAPAFALRHCVTWNVTERNKAQRDAANVNLIVPRHATKRVAGKLVQLTREEYRDIRHADAERFENNIERLEGLLA